MRVIVAAAMMLGLAAVSPAVAEADGARQGRRVELISMAMPTLDPGAAEQTVSDMAEPSVPATLRDAFQVHDLSRRQVEFRMAEEFKATQGPSVQAIGESYAAVEPEPVAPVSSILVPAWLLGPGASNPGLSIGCMPLAYRPAGFLRRDAETRRAAYYSMMSAIACEQGLPTALLDALVVQESGYNPLALSPKNAFGLAQLMPDTALAMGVDRFSPEQNLRGGARYLRQQLDRFGQVHLALAAYNAGPGRIRNGAVPEIAETRAYVSNVIARWTRLAGLVGSARVVSGPGGSSGRTLALLSF